MLRLMSDTQMTEAPVIWRTTEPPPIMANQFEDLRFTFVTRPGLLKITLVNFALNLLTLWFYRFWAKAKVRKHIWSSVHINGEPLEYTGNGLELFKGFLVVFFCLLLPFGLINALISIQLGPESGWLTLSNGLFALIVYVSFGFAIYKARKFQLTRTNWRGIRGNLVGSAWTYSLTYFGAMLAKSMSLGWATPAMNTELQSQIIGDMRFGDGAFKFKGRSGPLYPTYAICWFLMLFAVIAGVIFAGPIIYLILEPLMSGQPDQAAQHIWAFLLALAGVLLAYLVLYPLLWAIYQAKELRTFADYTRFDGAQFRLDVTTFDLVKLTVINVLILVFTLGVFMPFVQRRLARFLIDNLTLEGKVDIDRIKQSQAQVDTRGEGLADAFDVGGF